MKAFWGGVLQEIGENVAAAMWGMTGSLLLCFGAINSLTMTATR